MDNTTRLLQKIEEQLAGRHWLIVNGCDPALRQLPGKRRHWHCDRCQGDAAPTTMLPEIAEHTDLIILLLPKSLAQLSMQVRALRGQLQSPCELWLVGPAKGGIKGGVSTLAREGISMVARESARHCKLFAGELQPGNFELATEESCYEVEGLTVCTYPGVFSEQRLDRGTHLLLEAMAASEPPASALDVGCGAGVISAWLASRGVAVTAVDVSATAVAATRRTLELNGLEGDVRQSDLYAAVSERFTWLVTNPPFHQGRDQTFEVTRALIQGASRHLHRGGCLWLVANSHLPYPSWLAQSFARVERIREEPDFTVYRAWPE